MERLYILTAVMKKSLQEKLMKMENLCSHLISTTMSVSGELKTQVKVTMPGFAPRLFSGAFIVVGASDSSPNGELDNNVQNHVQNPKSPKRCV